jgi:hypothetical protein
MRAAHDSTIYSPKALIVGYSLSKDNKPQSKITAQNSGQTEHSAVLVGHLSM